MNHYIIPKYKKEILKNGVYSFFEKHLSPISFKIKGKKSIDENYLKIKEKTFYIYWDDTSQSFKAIYSSLSDIPSFLKKLKKTFKNNLVMLKNEIKTPYIQWGELNVLVTLLEYSDEYKKEFLEEHLYPMRVKGENLEKLNKSKYIFDYKIINENTVDIFFMPNTKYLIINKLEKLGFTILKK